MELRQRLQRALEFSRGFTEKLLSDFKTPEDWMSPAVAGSNHALWIAGHLAVADDAFTAMLEPALADPRDDYRGWFGRGSRPVLDPQHYAPPEVILEYMRQRRGAFLQLLDELPEADFVKPTPSTAPPFMYDYGSVFHMAAWHETLHTGQLTLIRRQRGLGALV